MAKGELTLTRAQVRSAVHDTARRERGGDDRHDPRPWEEAGHRLGVRPGLAFMVATGVPADGSGVPELSDRVDGGPDLASPQVLVNPRGHNPLRNELVEAWVRGRAERELG